MSPTRWPQRSQALLLGIVLAISTFVWVANSSGILSSNDGSHIALARALALRGETKIDSERALTLEVDLAQRAGHSYSDRPPGTAFGALIAVRIGAALDPQMTTRAIEQARSGAPINPLPAAKPYIATYAARGGPSAPRLVDLIGTSIAVSLHGVLVGLLGLLLLDLLLGRVGLGPWSRVFALLSLALATAWGPYTTALFSHVSAATAVVGVLVGVIGVHDNNDEQLNSSSSPIRLRLFALLAGFAGAWAIACDYLLILAIVPACALCLPWRTWLWVLLGTAPIALATMAYHHAAFGSVFALGYDHQVNFAFARQRGTTFSGDLLDGLWTLWGAGHQAGLLVLAPITLVGLAGLLWSGHRAAPEDRRARLLTVALLGFSPWILALALHRTPWGGGTQDHRYLIPILPFAALGLGLLWERAPIWLRAAALGLATLSSVLVWRHFLGWHEGEAFDRAGPALVLALVPLLACPASSWLRARWADEKSEV